MTRLGRLLETRLIEVDREGRFERLEAATAAGMITLHPSPDGRRLHGNVVSAGGVRHLTLGWGPAHRLLVSGSPASVAVVCHDLDAQVPPGTTTQFRGVAVDAELRLIEGSLRIERTGYRDWRVSAPTTAVVAETELDERGLPAGLGVWPLEEPAPD